MSGWTKTAIAAVALALLDFFGCGVAIGIGMSVASSNYMTPSEVHAVVAAMLLAGALALLGGVLFGIGAVRGRRAWKGTS